MFRKVAAFVVSLSVVLSFCSCSLFGANPEEIVKAADIFADALIYMDADEIADLTTEKKTSKALKALEELFDDSGYSFEQNKFIEAVAGTLTYEIDEDSVEISKDTASVDVVFTMVDYEVALSGSEFTDISEVIAAINSCDEIIDYTVTFEFEKVEDEWLLTNLKDKHFAGLFSFCTYEFDIKPDLESLMEGTDIWSDSIGVYGSVWFTEPIDDVALDVTYDVYRDDVLIKDECAAIVFDGYIYCDYSNADYSNIETGEYVINVNYDGEMLCSMTIIVTAPAASPVIPSMGGDNITVGIVNLDPNESGYRTANDYSFKQVFTEDNGYEASFYYSMRNDEQIQGAENFIYEGVDYLLICPADTSGWDTVVEDAYNAGIKVIFFDRMADVDPSYYLTYVHTDPRQEGDQAVEWLSAQDLPEYNIIHLQGVLRSSAQIGRTDALDLMVAAYGQWNYVTQQPAEWDAEIAQDIVESVIASGEDFNVIYAENDDMAQGAVAALDAAGISHGPGGDVIIISFDCSEWALEEVLAGSWNYDQQCNPFQAPFVSDVIQNFEAGVVPDIDIVVDEMGFDATTITASDVDNYGL